MKREFLVKSETDKTKFYKVSMFTDSYQFKCQCPDHKYRHRDCKHIKIVEKLLKGIDMPNVNEISKKKNG